MPNQNGRNMNENRGERERSWRPQDDDRSTRDRDERSMRDDDDRHTERGDRDRTERYGGGQSGYGAGRFGDDRSMGSSFRNQQQGGRQQQDDRQGMNTDDRWSGRGGQGHWEDRTERTGYNSGYNQGGMGYGQQGGGMQRDWGNQQGFRGGSGGAQQHANDYNQQRYPDEYGPGEYGQGGHQGRFGQGGNYQQQDFAQGTGYGQGTGGRWANVPQSGLQHGNYQQGQGGYGQQDQGRYGQGYYGQQGGQQGSFGSQSGYGSREVGSFGQQQGGLHRGKGPMGYQRSDERIKETVCEALHDDDHIDASHVEVIVKNGEVTLTGTVDDRRQKRLAEDCVERLPGVKDVQNQLRVGTGKGNQNIGNAVGRTETETSSDKKHRA